MICKGRAPADDPKRFKYKCAWWKVVCDCGTEKWLPEAGIAGYKSCGCTRYEWMKTIPAVEVKYQPNKPVMGKMQDINRSYADL